MVMSNMNTNRNKTTNGTRSANKTNQQRQKLHREEFGAEFELDSASAQINNFAETQGKTGSKQPASERTAWH
jgi:hypothetical protein